MAEYDWSTAITSLLAFVVGYCAGRLNRKRG